MARKLTIKHKKRLPDSGFGSGEASGFGHGAGDGSGYGSASGGGSAYGSGNGYGYEAYYFELDQITREKKTK